LTHYVIILIKKTIPLTHYVIILLYSDYDVMLHVLFSLSGL
jgi:hypothetical protein